MSRGFADAAERWYRVLAVRDPGRARGSAEQDFISVLPAALSAARRSAPFIAAWLSRGGGAPLELITNSGPMPDRDTAPSDRQQPAGPMPDRDTAAPSNRGQPAGMLFPAGARGIPAGESWLAALEGMVWTACPGRQAPALMTTETADSEEDGAPGGLFESTLLNLVSRPFGWVVVAEPVGSIDAEIADLRMELDVRRHQDREQSRFDVQRAERRLAELDRCYEGGLWSVRVLAGATSEEELRVLAPVLVGSVDLRSHPYRLRSADGPGVPGARKLADALAAEAALAADGTRVPFTATAGLLVALVGVPRREVPGLRVLDPGQFDLTSETDERISGDPTPGQADSISIGEILDGQDRPVGAFQVPLATLNRHTFVTGATGAGKSQTVRHMLEQLTRCGLPWLAIEPVKSEYAAMAGRIADLGELGEVTVINPSDPGAVPLSVNPLAPEPGYPVQAHIDMIRALFMAAFDAEQPFPQIMAQALQRVYEASGWDVVTGGAPPGVAAARAGPAVPTLGQLQNAAKAVVDDVGYGKELRADVQGFVDVRLRSLRVGSAGRFFEGGHPADIGELLRRNIVLAIEDVANDEDKAFLMGTLIIRIVEHLRLRARRGQPGGLRHVIVIEEAHRLLRARREDRASAHAVELFASMLAEIRAYGEGLVIAEQIPAKLVPDVVKNTALKLVHRLPARDDREMVGAAMNLDDGQSRKVVSLEPGVAAVFADGMDRPLRIKVPFGAPRERPCITHLIPPVASRRSPACGPGCAGGTPCTLRGIRQADLLARADTVAEAWLRVWVETMVLGFLTNMDLPAPPAAVRNRWAELEPRLRECALATITDTVVATRAQALRASYDLARLAASVADAARQMLEHGTAAGKRAGPSWVIPQVRWLHEAERVRPMDGPAPDPLDKAPALDFDVPGLANWPGMRVGDRVMALRRSAVSMELARNRLPAWNALLGDDDQRGFTDDLGSTVVGAGLQAQLRHAAAVMGVAGWLEIVLSWPRRFVADENRLSVQEDHLNGYGPAR
ncbi:MAG TPA: ATP-binding protein [Streptosporangiaceae bacterium]|nr:ATP-binding protein [Streptosporangiaceae bacterium]